MAGIAGLMLKQKFDEIDKYHSVLEKMLEALAVSKSQKRGFYAHSHHFFGNVIPLSRQINDHFQHNSFLNIYCVVDGLIFVDENEKSIIQNHYPVMNNDSDYDLIPYLYDYYKADSVNHITGWYNIFLNEFKRTLKQLKPDLVMSWEMQTALYSLLLFKKLGFYFINGSIQHGMRLF